MIRTKVLIRFCQKKYGLQQCFQLFHGSSLLLKKPPLKPPPKNFKKFPVQGSIQFVARQLSDPYVKQRFREGYRCRSVYKLKEIDDKHRIFAPGMSVVDLGAAPGSWSQVSVERIICFADIDEEKQIKPPGNGGQVIAVDLVRFIDLDHVFQINGDFTNIEIQKKVTAKLHSGKADVVLCDAAPNASGVKNHDQLRLIKLAASAGQFALKVLKPHGAFLCKVWDCPEAYKLNDNLKKYFETVKRLKPEASRVDSMEYYILCQNFMGFVKQ